MDNKQKKLLAAVAVVGLLLIGWLVWRSGGPAAKVDESVIGEDITVSRVYYAGDSAGTAYVSLPYLKNDDRYILMNVAIDLNRDGELAAYSTADGQTQEEWVVKNHRAKVWGGGNTVGFDLLDQAVAEAGGRQLFAYLTAEPISSLGELPAARAEAQKVISEFLIDDYADRFQPGDDPESEAAGAVPTLISEDLGPTPGPMATTPSGRDNEPYLTDITVADSGELDGAPAIGAAPAAAGDGLPPAGEDFEVFQTDVPDMYQGVNECVPTSTSNSLHWLGERFGFADRLPDNQRATMNELKDDLNWRADGGVQTRTDFIPGKVAFVRRHNLPIYTHQIGTELDNDIMRKIAVELAKGQAVEVVIGYYTQNAETGAWTRHGGHMMTAVGSWTTNGETYIGVHDPLSPANSRLDLYNVDGKRIYNYPYRGNTKVFINRAFAESVTEEWISEHPPQTAIQTAGGMFEQQDLQNVWFIEVLQIGDVFYPIQQFERFTAPACPESCCGGDEHWHAKKGTAWGLNLAGHKYFETNPATIRARNASVSEWRDPFGSCGAGRTADVRVRTIMISRSEAAALIAQIVD